MLSHRKHRLWTCGIKGAFNPTLCEDLPFVEASKFGTAAEDVLKRDVRYRTRSIGFPGRTVNDDAVVTLMFSHRAFERSSRLDLDRKSSASPRARKNLVADSGHAEKEQIRLITAKGRSEKLLEAFLGKERLIGTRREHRPLCLQELPAQKEKHADAALVEGLCDFQSDSTLPVVTIRQDGEWEIRSRVVRLESGRHARAKRTTRDDDGG